MLDSTLKKRKEEPVHVILEICRSLYWPHHKFSPSLNSRHFLLLLLSMCTFSVWFYKELTLGSGRICFLYFEWQVENYLTVFDLVTIVKLIKFIFDNTSTFFLQHFFMAVSLCTSISRLRMFIWSNYLGVIWNYYSDIYFLSNRGFVSFCFLYSCDSSQLDVK